MIHRVSENEPCMGLNKQTVVIKSFFYSYRFRYSERHAIVLGLDRTASGERNTYGVNGATGHWGKPAFDELRENGKCHLASHYVERLGKPD